MSGLDEIDVVLALWVGDCGFLRSRISLGSERAALGWRSPPRLSRWRPLVLPGPTVGSALVRGAVSNTTPRIAEQGGGEIEVVKPDLNAFASSTAPCRDPMLCEHGEAIVSGHPAVIGAGE